MNRSRRTINKLSESTKLASDLDLQKLYREYNRLYFDGELPNDINISTSSRLKNAIGVTRVKRRGDDVVPGTVKVVLSSHYLWDEEDLKKTLLHEMIHVWENAVLGKFDRNHGANFQTKRKVIERASGMKIPDTHKGGPLGLNPELAKRTPVNAVLVTEFPNGSIGLVVISKRTYTNQGDLLRGIIKGKVDDGQYKESRIYMTNHVITRRFPTRSSLKRSIKYSLLSDSGMELLRKFKEEAGDSLIWVYSG